MVVHKKKAQTLHRFRTTTKVHALVIRLWTLPDSFSHYDYFITEMGDMQYVSGHFFNLQDAITEGIDKLGDYGQVSFTNIYGSV